VRSTRFHNGRRWVLPGNPAVLVVQHCRRELGSEGVAATATYRSVACVHRRSRASEPVEDGRKAAERIFGAPTQDPAVLALGRP
jgi:hypothetical protein